MYKHNNILNLWNKAIGVGQTQQHLKSLCGTNTTNKVWDKHNNILNNKAIGVGQTQQHLKPVK